MNEFILWLIFVLCSAAIVWIIVNANPDDIQAKNDREQLK